MQYTYNATKNGRPVDSVTVTAGTITEAGEAATKELQERGTDYDSLNAATWGE